MANIKYSRLINELGSSNGYTRWAKGRIPVAFLKQQIFLLVIILSSLLLLIITTFFTSDVDYDQMPSTAHEIDYGVVVDCGSSGTRAHIFTWRRADGRSPTSKIELLRDSQKKPLSKHITPGLSTLRDKPENASEYMEPIMNFISESIPYDRHISTPIYFMATAGMRLLDESTQKKILFDITRDLRAKYYFPRIKSQVITGQYEGAYSWLSVNSDRYYNDSSTQSKSIGIIEMGGASTQVTFELNNDTESLILDGLKDAGASATFKNQIIKLDLSKDTSVKLFATSFLGLGVNSAREFAIDLLVRDSLNGTGQLGEHKPDLKNFDVSLYDPCLTNGSSEMVLRPAEVISSMDRSIGFVLEDQNNAFKVRLEGSGNFLNCLALLERVIKAIKSEGLNCTPSKQSCPMTLLGTNFIPFKHYSFVGLSEMYFTTNEIMNLAGTFNRSHVLRETNRICSTDYSQLQLKSHGFVSYKDRILYECFKASWLLTILHNSGLKMPVNYDNFETLDRIHDREIDWTIGAMLWETLARARDF
uniref:Ectonucleoside triphosphate diphosphohydrolase 7 n=1 Tax=Aceria tosichella TaxID=561515 RepID=A0A6G1SKH6_9ACAR